MKPSIEKFVLGQGVFRFSFFFPRCKSRYMVVYILFPTGFLGTTGFLGIVVKWWLQNEKVPDFFPLWPMSPLLTLKIPNPHASNKRPPTYLPTHQHPHQKNPCQKVKKKAKFK